jgi:DNA repair exonuclease SbcCD ATPase subunit
MKLIATGDHHWNERRRFAESVRIHREIAELVAAEKPDVFLSGGDLYEGASTPVEREAVADWVTSVAEHCPVLVTKGNHDRPVDCLLLRRLRTRHPVIIEEGAGIHRIGGAQIAAMAWPTREGLLKMSVDTDVDRDSLTSEALRAVLRWLGSQFEDLHGPRILLGHFMVDGSVTSTGQELVGTPCNVSLSDLDLVGAQIGLMSHIHKFQQWESIGTPYLYTGSPLRQNFGELEDKSVTVVEFNGAALVSIRQVPTSATRMVLVDWGWEDGWVCSDASHGFPLVGAEVRFRYRVSSEKRTQAAHEAAKLRDEWLAQGTVSMQVEPVIEVKNAARAPEIALAHGMAEKLPAFWAARATTPEEPRRSRLLDLAGQVEANTPRPVGISTGACLLDWIKLRGIGPFKQTVEIDFQDLPPGIVAFTGRIGSGKTTLMDSYAAALYRKLPTSERGLLSKMAVSRDAFVDVGIQNGKSLRIVHAIDAGKQTAGWEVSVYDRAADGSESLTGSSKVSSFDDWREQNMLPMEIFLAGPYQAQGANALVNALDSERASIILRALGLEYYETMAETFRKRASAAREELEKATARVDDERARGGDVAQCEQAVVDERMGLGPSQWALQVARDALTAAEQAIREHSREQEAYLEAVASRGELESKIRDNRAQHTDLTERLTNNRKRLNQKPKILAAVKRSDDLRASISAAEAELARLTAEHQGLQREELALRQEAAGNKQSSISAQARAESAQRRLGRKPEIDAATASIPGLRTAWDAASKAAEETVQMVRGDVAGAEAELERLRGQRVAGADERITGLRSGLASVVECEGESEDMAELAASTLDRDTIALDTAAELPSKITRQAAEVTRLRRLLDTVTLQTGQKRDEAARALSKAEQVAVEATHLESAQTELEAALGDLHRYQQAERACVAKSTEVVQRRTAAGSERDTNERMLASLKEELQKLSSVVAYKEQADKAEARIEQLEQELRRVAAEHTELTHKLSRGPAVVLPPLPPPDVSGLRIAVGNAESQVQAVTTAIARAEQRLELARQSALRILELEASRAERSEALSDCQRLAEDLGKKGLQSAEIDAVGPELTADTNDLLHSCLGSTFTVSVETTKKVEQGKREVDALPIVVFNSEDGYEGEVRTYSGGQKALIGEALALALTILSCRRNGITHGLTLCRDEPTA